MRFPTLFVILLGLMLFGLACTGGRKDLNLRHLRYPVSMSPAVYGPDGEVLGKGLLSGLKVVHKLKIRKRFYSFFWSQLRITREKPLANAINDTIRREGGEGIINFKVETEGCGWNVWGIRLGLIGGIVPLWPGCVDAVFTGDVIKRR